jgi:pimeloyl-ACP methyl ester carboxylesterase
MTYVCSPDNDPYKTYTFRHCFTWGARWVVNSFSNGFLYKVGQAVDKSKFMDTFGNIMWRHTLIKLSRPNFRKWRHAFLTSGKALKRCINSCSKHGKTIGKMMEKVDVPTLVIGATHDVLVEPAASYRIHKKIPGSEFHIFQFSMHGPMLQQPKKFKKVLTDFLKKQNSK